MRVMLDSNILISALLFPSGRVDTLFRELVLNHTIVISSYVVDEVREVIRRKFPQKEKVIEKFFASISYEYVHTPRQMYIDEFVVRDFKDYPVVYSALHEEVDVLLSGDKDLSGLCVENMEILTPSQFLEKYSV